MRPGTPFSSQGKRGAFAFFYGPMHLILIRRIVRELGAGRPAPGADPGPRLRHRRGRGGLGHRGRAEAATERRRAQRVGRRRRSLDLAAAGASRHRADRRPETAQAARQALRHRSRLHRQRAVRAPTGRRCWQRLIVATRKGAQVLIVEPISRRISPWWDEWAAALAPRGGRADTWRFACDLPDPLARLDKAAGLNHRELTARSLYIPPPHPNVRRTRAAGSVQSEHLGALLEDDVRRDAGGVDPVQVAPEAVRRAAHLGDQGSGARRSRRRPAG